MVTIPNSLYNIASMSYVQHMKHITPNPDRVVQSPFFIP